MVARYYNSATGRFLSPDGDAKSGDPVPYAKLDNPQSLNLYSPAAIAGVTHNIFRMRAKLTAQTAAR